VTGPLRGFINRIGGVQCVDVETGEIHWQHRLPGQSWASPVAHEGHVVFFTTDGTVVTLKSGPELVEVGESTISATDVVYGAAAVNGSWIIRTGRGLLRVSGPVSD
jgi:outer membrane protein assembly factor BamB